MATKTDGKTAEKDSIGISKDLPRDVELAIRKLELKLAQNYELSQGILRQGTQLIIPEEMSYKDAARLLMEVYKQAEEEEEVHHLIRCHPGDGLYQFHKALKEEFGNVVSAPTVIETMFGHKLRAPSSLNVQVGVDDYVSLPFGTLEIQLPIEITVTPISASEFNDAKSPLDGGLKVEFKAARKYKPLIQKIIDNTTKRIKTDSIFFGKAIDTDCKFIDLNADTSMLVYSRSALVDLDANVFNIIRNTKEVKKYRNIRTHVLLMGGYGTGKSLTLLETAKLCVENGWTCVLNRGTSLTTAVEIARRYQPCVVQYEDVDVEVGGDRGTDLNEILNTLDGALGKSDKIIVMMTTNHPERLNRAMLRPGRIDVLISLDTQDEASVVQLVKNYAGVALRGELDGQELFKHADHMPPAFIAGGVVRALSYALADHNIDPTTGEIFVRPQNIYDALANYRPQLEQMLGKQEKPDVVRIEDIIERKVNDALVDIKVAVGVPQ